MNLVKVAVAGFVAVLLTAGNGEAGPGRFCSRDVLRDYERLLTGRPQAGRFPASGKLRVGPPGLRVFPPEESLVAIGHDRFELRGSLASRGSARPLRWWVTSRLVRIGRNATRGAVVREKRQHIATVEGFGGRDFGFGGRVPTDLYRLTVAFENARRGALAGYREYYYALPARSDLKLAVDQPLLRHGETGLLRIDNLGTVDTSYSPAYRIWSAGDRSRQLPLGSTPLSDDHPHVQPGWMGRCLRFEIPDDAPVGEYEIGVRATNVLLNEPVLLKAHISVLP
jgi:hypothetical protein